MSAEGSLIPITDEQAKALQEALKTLRGLGDFAQKALGSVPEDLVGLLGGDWLKVRRAENMVRMMREAKERLRARGVKDPEPASLRIALPIIRAAADEDRDELSVGALVGSSDGPIQEKLCSIGVDRNGEENGSD
jgi:hypothetical protein